MFFYIKIQNRSEATLNFSLLTKMRDDVGIVPYETSGKGEALPKLFTIHSSLFTKKTALPSGNAVNFLYDFYCVNVL